jgi:hypothetical protein
VHEIVIIAITLQVRLIEGLVDQVGSSRRESVQEMHVLCCTVKCKGKQEGNEQIPEVHALVYSVVHRAAPGHTLLFLASENQFI